MRSGFLAFSALALLGCGSDDQPASPGGAGSGGVDAGPDVDVNANDDGDCLTNVEEVELGTDPALADSDGDGFDDCAEIDCKSRPTDATHFCYACGWTHGDPGNLQSTGAAVGDVIENVPLVDQCGDTVPLWEFAGQYRMLFMTTVW